MMSGLEAWARRRSRDFHSSVILSGATQLAAPMQVYSGTNPTPINMRSVGVAYALAQDAHSKAYDAYLNLTELRR
jgi:hypothetical protein